MFGFHQDLPFSIEIYGFREDGQAFFAGELHTKTQTAIDVWSYFEEKYLPPYRPSYVPSFVKTESLDSILGFTPTRVETMDISALSEIWALAEDPRLTREERIVLWTTRLLAAVRRENFSELIRALDSFPVDKDAMKAQSKIIRRLQKEDCIAAAWSQNVFGPSEWACIAFEKKKDQAIPYNIKTGDTHFFVFDKLGDFGPT